LKKEKTSEKNKRYESMKMQKKRYAEQEQNGEKE